MSEGNIMAKQANFAIRGNILTNGVQIHGTVVVGGGRIITVTDNPEYAIDANENIRLRDDEVLFQVSWTRMCTSTNQDEPSGRVSNVPPRQLRQEV